MKNSTRFSVKSAAAHEGVEFKRMFVPLDVKSVSDKGQVSGYASIFGNVDLGGDVITKDNPFKEYVTDDEGMVVMLFAHDSGGAFQMSASGGMPIGRAAVEQNSKGLKFDGQLVMEDPFVSSRVLPHMKAKTLRGMSIGYDVLPGGAKILDSGVRELSALRLWEISPVIFGMNPKASIDTVKSIARCNSVRELEDLLRDAAGLSISQAKRHAGEIWRTVSGPRDAGDADAEAQTKEAVGRIVDFLSSIKS